MEKVTDVGGGEHGGVVEGIAGGDDVVVERAQGFDGFFLLIRDTQFVVCDFAVFDDEAMAEECGPIELAHEGLGEFFEGVGKNDHLRDGAEFVEELFGAGQGTQTADDFLDVANAEVVLGEDFKAALHQYVVIGNVARGEAEFGNRGFFRDGDPDFGHEHALHVQRYDALFHAREGSPKKDGRCPADEV